MTLSALRELAAALSRLQVCGGRGAVATLLEVKGGSASRPGSRVLLTDEEQLVGEVTLGGCAGPRLLQTLREVRDTGTPQLLTLNLGEESYEFGLTCTAQLELLVQPTGAAEAAYFSLLELLDAGHRAALVTFQNGEQLAFNSADVPPLPLPLGAAARAYAHAGFDAGSNAVCLYERGRPTALLERFVPAPRLILVGAGAVSVALATFARTLDFRVTVIDTEPLRLTEARFPHAERRLVGGTEPALDARALAADDHLVLASHNYADEVAALKETVFSDAGYLGLIASQRRGRAVLDFLGALGVPEARLERIRTPAGLALGAATPPEIAVSIFGEILAVRARRTDRTLAPPSPAGS